MEHHQLGTSSKAHLSEVKPGLQDVVTLALRKCRIDFSVVDGRRTWFEQSSYVAAGTSWTMRSNHLPDIDGLAGAVDIYPWVDGKTSHDGYHYALIARAMFEAAIELGVQIRWGGFGRRKYRKEIFEGLDRPHWELVGHEPVMEEAA